jgi:hypothetical protein
MRKYKKRKLKEIDLELISRLYLEGVNLYNIGKQTNTSSTLVRDRLLTLGIKIKSPNVDYTVDHEYFNKIDSSDKAYFLGLLYADGNIYKNKVGIGLQEEDGYILEKFKKYIKSDQKLYIRKENISFFDKEKTILSKRKPQYRLYISSKNLVFDLIKLGCVPKKSLILTFPSEDQVPKEFQSHFIRGYFDGDGNINITKCHLKKLNIAFVGTKDMIENINHTLHKVLNIPKQHIFLDKKDSKIFKLAYGSKEVCKKIYDYLYKDCEDLYLTRKKEKFDNYDFSYKASYLQHKNSYNIQNYHL